MSESIVDMGFDLKYIEWTDGWIDVWKERENIADEETYRYRIYHKIYIARVSYKVVLLD